MKTYLLKYILFTVICILCLSIHEGVAQVNCTTNTPFFTVDLTGSPSGTWISPSVSRNGSCCGGGANQTNCIELMITLDPGAEGIIFNVESGANPGGALYYQLNCNGVPVPSTTAPICLNGVGPHLLTYCKVGNNQNTYSITSVPAPSATTSIITADGCQDTLMVTGLQPSTITWTSVAPGALGQYNNYLNNVAGNQPGVSGVPYTGQPTVIVTPQPNYPSQIQYQVCGTVVGSCSAASFCEIATVSIVPTLFAAINPDVPTICFGAAGVEFSAIPVGGAARYTFLWFRPSNNCAKTKSIVLTAVNYYLRNESLSPNGFSEIDSDSVVKKVDSVKI